MKKNIRYTVIGIITALLFQFNSSAQYFPPDYFAPKTISAQPKSNNSFFYASYGIKSIAYFDDILDLDIGAITEKPYMKDFSLAWFTNKNGQNHGGFELMFNYEGISEHYAYWDWKSYQLKITTVGTKGVGWSFYGTRDIFDTENGLWGFGAEVQFGGHPLLTEGRTKWPFSLTLGDRLSYQTAPLGVESDAWQTIKKDNLIDAFSYAELYAKMAFQRMSYKKGLRLYLRLDFEVTLENSYLYSTDYGYIQENFIWFKTGFSAGILF
jgi:hypothetical protein